VKLRMYARARVPDYWIVDTKAETVDVCREPTADTYRSVQRFGRDSVITPLAFPELTIGVADLFV
jgi:Uma2 family endonuclease